MSYLQLSHYYHFQRACPQRGHRPGQPANVRQVLRAGAL